MNILAIETSCDETSVAVVENGHTLRSLVVNSQIDLHKAFGGVVPEIAARSHIEVMLPVITQALEEAFGVSHQHQEDGDHTPYPLPHTSQSNLWDQIDAIAVTQGPGLSGSLLIGVLTARTLAWTFGKPLIPVHHILGHVYANWIVSGKWLEWSGEKKLSPTHHSLPTKAPEFPVLALIVSGGHTQLMYGTTHDDWRVIGRTTDDAVGEAFDKAAKILGLPYPGGPSISKAAKAGDPNKYLLPTPKVSTIDPGLEDLRSQFFDLRENTTSSVGTSKIQNPRSKISYDFSFSGLKTALLRAVQKECGKTHDFPSFELAGLLSETQRADFAASFEKTAINYLVSHTKAAFEEFQPSTVIIGGGVAASLTLRAALSEALPIEIEYAPQILCTDNAAMIGARAHHQLRTEEPADPKTLEIKPSWPL